jgi:hypothetical protein
MKFDAFQVNGLNPAGRREALQKAALASVLEKFPEGAALIRELFQHNPSFQSLCEDYRDCLAAWQYWRQADSAEAPALCRSYAEVRHELEQEVRQYLEEKPSRGSRSGNGQAADCS